MFYEELDRLRQPVLYQICEDDDDDWCILDWRTDEEKRKKNTDVVAQFAESIQTKLLFESDTHPQSDIKSNGEPMMQNHESDDATSDLNNRSQIQQAIQKGFIYADPTGILDVPRSSLSVLTENDESKFDLLTLPPILQLSTRRKKIKLSHNNAS